MHGFILDSIVVISDTGRRVRAFDSYSSARTSLMLKRTIRNKLS